MDRLFPVELLELICDFTEFATLKNLRLTCKTLADITTPRLFSHFYMGFFPTHLTRLIQLAENPTLSACIKHFTLVGDILPDFGSQEAYEKLIDLRPPWSTFRAAYTKQRSVSAVPAALAHDHLHSCDLSSPPALLDPHERMQLSAEYASLPRHNLTPSDVSKHYQKWNLLRQQQLSWSDHEHALFARAFATLPNLVIVSNKRCEFSDNNVAPPWKSLRRGILVGPDDWMMGIGAEVTDGPRHNSQTIWEDPVHMEHTVALMAGILERAKQPHVSPIQTLQLRNIASQPFLKPASSYTTRPPYQCTMTPSMDAFRHLRFLRLDINYELWVGTHGSQFTRIHSLLTQLSNMLTSAINLQHLNLNLVDDDFDFEDLIDAEMLEIEDLLTHLGTPSLPALHTLELSCTTTQKSLKTFLEKSAVHVRTLRLIDCSLFLDETWHSLLSHFPILMPWLESVYLEGLRDISRPNHAFFDMGLGIIDDSTTAHENAIIQHLLGHAAKDAVLPLLNFEELEDVEIIT